MGGGFHERTITITVNPLSPQISSFSPMSGPVGTKVTISGSNFTATATVILNGVAATPNFISSSLIEVFVPAGATSGKFEVTTPAGTATSRQTFRVDYLKPTITSFTPASGPVLTTVIITGTNFTNVTGIKFNKTSVTSYQVQSATTISAVVPAGATTGFISVTTPGGTASSKQKFQVTSTVRATAHGNDTENLLQESQLKCSPNPAIGNAFITYQLQKGSDYKLELCTITGEVIALLKEAKVEVNKLEQYQLATNGISSGLYLIRLSSDQETLIFKLLVEN